MRRQRKINESYIFRTPWLSLREDSYESSSKSSIDNFYIVQRPDFVVVVPITSDGEFILVEQYRHGLEKKTLNFPMGFVKDGERPVKSASRELLEETGLVANNIKSLCVFSLAPSFMNTCGYVFLASNLRKRRKNKIRDSKEVDKIVRFGKNQIEPLIKRGKLIDLSSICSYFMIKWRKPLEFGACYNLVMKAKDDLRQFSMGNRDRKAFTLVEVLLFIAILSVMALAFSSVLISATRVQVKQGAVAEVDSQSQFLLQTIQRYVESSSLIEMASDSATTTLKLRMASSSGDPAYIYLSGGSLYLKETDGGAPQVLNSSKVTVANLSFTKHSNPGGPDSVGVAFTVSYNTSNAQQQFSQTIGTAVARVNAATFDSNVLPSVGNTYKIGVSSQIWQSLNDLIYFSGSNVGIGVSNPGQSLEVNGGARLNTTTAKPACSAAAGTRGTFWVTQNGTGVKDNVEVCVKNASDTYLWATIY